MTRRLYSPVECRFVREQNPSTVSLKNLEDTIQRERERVEMIPKSPKSYSMKKDGILTSSLTISQLFRRIFLSAFQSNFSLKDCFGVVTRRSGSIALRRASLYQGATDTTSHCYCVWYMGIDRTHRIMN